MALANFNRTMNAGDLLTQVAVEVGLPKVNDPFTTSDPQYQRMIQILNIAGNALLKLAPWSRFQNVKQINVTPGQSSYPLPEDFDSMIDETMWQPGTSFITGFGSTSPQLWEYFLNVPVVGTLTIIYRERFGGIQVLPVPQSAFSFTFEYVSRGWVTDANQSGTYRDNVAQASDIVLFDPLLIGRYLKMRFLEALGFDTQGAKDDFNLVFDSLASQDTSKMTLSAATGPSNGFNLLGVQNIPETGFGF
jgi:hypothetical protein